MTERVPSGDSGCHAEDTALARHVEAVNWLMQVNRRLHDRALLPIWVLDREVARLESELNHARGYIAAYEQSTSWRLTAPLRWIMQRMAPRPLPGPPAEMALPTAEAADDDLVRRPDPFADYAAWIAHDEAACQAAIHPALIGRTMVVKPRLALILTAIGAAQDALAATLEAFRGHIGLSCSLIATCRSTDAGREMLERFARSEPNATVLVMPDGTTAAASKAAALAKAAAEFICFLDPPDRIAPTAVRLISEAIALDPETDLVFSDEDILDAEGRRGDPFFKPGWDPELQRAGDLLGRLLVLRGDTLRRIGLPPDTPGSDWFRELGQRAATACRPDRIRHIPAILCHRAAKTRPATTVPPGRAAHLLEADVGTGTSPRWSRVRHAVPTPAPLVTLMVPIRDRADLLRTCADGVLHGTDYPEIELLILDNGTREPEAIKLLRHLESDDRVRTLSLSGPFNWSSLNNAGAHAARGSILVLLNNDIAVLQRDWLEELVSHAVRPEIGAVGAKLLYPDGTLQHAGMVINTDGVPKHVLRHAPADTECLNGMFSVAHSVSAVTGACLALRRGTFFEVGGLNESLAVACNDVDLCLRLLAHGYRNVWTPFAALEHRELASRGPDRTQAMRERAAEEFDRLSRDWGGAILVDPHFNPNLVLVDEQPSLRRRDWKATPHVAQLHGRDG